MLLADGSIIKVDDKHYPDLFWAIRGAGNGNFGIVLSLTLQAYPLKHVTVFRLTYQHEQLSNVLNYWQNWTNLSDVNLTSEFKCSNGKGSVFVEGIYLG